MVVEDPGFLFAHQARLASPVCFTSDSVPVAVLYTYVYPSVWIGCHTGLSTQQPFINEWQKSKES